MIKQFDQMRKMMNQATNGNFGGIDKMMGGGLPTGNFGQKVQNFAMKQAARRLQKAKKKRGRK